MSNLINIQDVRVYIDERGTAQLNLEDVARGLGFTTVATSGNEVVRWSRVHGYLEEMGFSQQPGKEGFIPENTFYRLAMKAKNAVAEIFQIKVADEILPEIRKTGQYSVQALDKDAALAIALRKTADVMEQLPQIQSRLERVENNTTINYGQQRRLAQIGNEVVLTTLGGADSSAYRNNSLRAKTYSALWRDHKDYFQINSMRDTLVKDFDKALDRVSAWYPQGLLLREIENMNRQMAL
ncbi:MULTISPECIES: ORF6C domain-containing protein [unclassified Paenibacillus]|uniref:ORF6C domain-containing protein n=1 Tax=unclassified Paenibacillus TaxID=185978 RepID=UPI0009CE46AC|nr:MULTISPECIES: ORF6C domain-containing protein [unclassified Paenibacillus]SLJ98380.1 BRO family, N-terminal domain [Paenibacillus sp. RU5A]SOC66770.1 BRO family, N-terminal domain [Paenibacillus sp. RU26A]SOC70081.1 BRO family, N-terminal domain [Paenibacillus sp. RU5M]